MEISSNVFPVPRADMHVVTADGTRIPVHSTVLASVSRVLENVVYGPESFYMSERVIRVLGVPCDAVVAFLGFLYGSLSLKEGKDAIERYGMHLVALSHKYGVEWLKRLCEAEMAERLTADAAVDALRVAKLCDAPRLYGRCMRLISEDFAAVQRTEGWRFVQRNDPRMELEKLHFLQDSDQRRKRWWRQRADQEMYRQLGEAMECLEHICTDLPMKNVSRTCDDGLRQLIRHFAACTKRLSADGACPHCRRMWQLFRLHSYVCDRSDSCRIPICKQFKAKMEMERKGDDSTWRLLAKKVTVARVMSSLAKRKRPAAEHLQRPLQRYRASK